MEADGELKLLPGESDFDTDSDEMGAAGDPDTFFSPPKRKSAASRSPGPVLRKVVKQKAVAYDSVAVPLSCALSTDTGDEFKMEPARKAPLAAPYLNTADPSTSTAASESDEEMKTEQAQAVPVIVEFLVTTVCVCLCVCACV
jgi:hypothetical protein